MRVAIMQPYLFPYGGYWRLLTQADVFVILDCVQFPRRGRVHRVEIAPGRWLGFPLMKAPQTTLIREMRLSAQAPQLMSERLAHLPFTRATDTPLRRQALSLLQSAEGALVDVLESSIRLIAAAIEAKAEILRSSTLLYEPSLRGQKRLIAISKRLGATHYLNSPGGRALYNPRDFRDNGLTLEFLPDYAGGLRWFLQSIFEMPVEEIAADIGRS